jgi:hypothetical protein
MFPVALVEKVSGIDALSLRIGRERGGFGRTS